MIRIRRHFNEDRSEQGKILMIRHEYETWMNSEVRSEEVKIVTIQCAYETWTRMRPRRWRMSGRIFGLMKWQLALRQDHHGFVK